MSSSPLSSWSVRYDSIEPSVTKLSAIPDALIGYMDPKTMSKYEHSSSKKVGVVETSGIQQAKAWELAMSPAKTLPMNMMMMWMSGSSVQIFSMMVVAMMITNPLKGITSMNHAFAPYRSPMHSLLPQMIVFVLCHLMGVALGVYKCWNMGLLPTESSDWLAWYEAPIPLEVSASLAM